MAQSVLTSFSSSRLVLCPCDLRPFPSCLDGRGGSRDGFVDAGDLSWLSTWRRITGMFRLEERGGKRGRKRERGREGGRERQRVGAVDDTYFTLATTGHTFCLLAK